MSDKELLELAAKAAGVKWIDPCFDYDEFGRMMLDFGEGVTEWNPLTSDGDALRLVVMLELLVHVETCYYVHAIKDGITATEHIGNGGKGCIFAATRRAVVRAAAEMAKRKEAGL